MQSTAQTVNLFTSVRPEPRQPMSAFSRFAAMYALDPDVMRFGRTCQPVNKTLSSQENQGNWICNPVRLY